MNEQQRLRRHISAVQFAMWELHLYLDSHPYCKEAAKKLAAYREEYDKLTVEYEKAYGPLNRDFALNEPLGVDQRPVAVGNGGERVMWIYEKKLQYPVRIKNPNPRARKAHHKPIRRPSRRIRRFPALPQPALLHALPGASGDIDGYRYLCFRNAAFGV